MKIKIIPALELYFPLVPLNPEGHAVTVQRLNLHWTQIKLLSNGRNCSHLVGREQYYRGILFRPCKCNTSAWKYKDSRRKANSAMKFSSILYSETLDSQCTALLGVYPQQRFSICLADCSMFCSSSHSERPAQQHIWKGMSETAWNLRLPQSSVTFGKGLKLLSASTVCWNTSTGESKEAMNKCFPISGHEKSPDIPLHYYLENNNFSICLMQSISISKWSTLTARHLFSC